MNDGNALLALCYERLTANLGKPFPEIALRDAQGTIRSTREYAGKRTAFFIAGPCHGAADWISRLAKDNWKLQGSRYDTLVFLVPLLATEGDAIPPSLPRFDISWPMPGFLSYCTAVTGYYIVAPDGSFEAYRISQLKQERRVETTQ